jgi:hypothetical protein
MNNLIGIGIPVYLLIGLIVVRQGAEGTPFEKCSREKDNLLGSRLMIVVGALLWPVMLALKLWSVLTCKNVPHD